MLKRCLLAAAILLPVVSPRHVHAQASAAATRNGILQVGAAYSNLATDEFKNRTQGVSIYTTFDLTPHLGAEGTLHFTNLDTPDGYSQKSYLVGLRYVAYRRHGIDPYGKFMIGIGSSTTNRPGIVAEGTPGNYFAYDFGGGVDYRLERGITIRAFDYEYERWPSFPAHALTPSVISVGVAYRIR